MADATHVADADIDALLSAWRTLEAARHEADPQTKQAAQAAFFGLLAQPPWSDPGYDPDSAIRDMEDPRRIEDATLAGLRPLLTWCERGERFHEGHQAALLEDGRIAALMLRLSTIAAIRMQARGHVPPATVAYEALNSRQRENHNFQKASAVLADYGFVTLRLSDDWQGADFIAQHIDGLTFLRVQLKSRMGVARKYRHRGLWLCFPHGGHWYLCPHDALLEYLLEQRGIGGTASWAEGGLYTQAAPGRSDLEFLASYRL